MKTKTKKPASTDIVVRSNSHVNEDFSKRKLAERIEPWVLSWIEKDYGFDAMVQIVSAIDGSKDLKIERNSFYLQLKATEKIKLSGDEITYSLPVKKVQQWIGHNVPVLFVLYDVPGDIFYMQWMDTHLLDSIEHANSSWSSQKSIAIKMPQTNVLDTKALDALNNTVINFRRPTITWIEPGRFFSLKDQCNASLIEYRGIAQRFAFVSMNKQLESLGIDIEKSIYRIAVTGLSRVGKSSLINALLKKEICPIGFYQTTAVPIEIVPGSKEQLTITFLDGTKKALILNNAAIESYASQDHNPDNNKKVARVTISIHNRNLQRGISVFDVPGLDDSNEDIVDYTLETVQKVNAILYVIDASPAEHGGYIFKREYKNHLLSFRQNIEKIFLVFNKADTLSTDKLDSLKERVVKDLKKLDLYESIADKIYFTTTATDKRYGGLDSITTLENDIWSYIVNENRGGISRLALLNKAIGQSIQDFHGLLKARMIDADKRIQLKVVIEKVKARIPELANEIKGKLNAVDKSIQGLLSEKKEALLMAFELYLEQQPLNNFPSKAGVKQFILQHLNQSMEAANIEYAQGMNQIKHYADNWIEDNLQQIRHILSTGAANRVIEFNELEQFESPSIDVSSSIGAGIIGWLFGILVVPEVALLAGITTFFANFLMSQEQKKAASILKTIRNCRDVCDKSYSKLTQQYHELAREQISHIGKYLDEKLKLYFEDLDIQMQQLPNISSAEKKLYQQAFTDMETLNNKLLKFDIEIMHY